jgi:hypothetical protein
VSAIAEALRALLADPETGLGVGVMGAIGAFIRDEGEAFTPLPLGMVTARSGLAIRAAARVAQRQMAAEAALG